MMKKLYVTKDKNGEVYLHLKKPLRFTNSECWCHAAGIHIPKTWFRKLTWEDEPIEVELKIKEN